MPFSFGRQVSSFFFLHLSLFGNFLAPNQLNCAEVVGGEAQLRSCLCASGGAASAQFEGTHFYVTLCLCFPRIVSQTGALTAVSVAHAHRAPREAQKPSQVC